MTRRVSVVIGANYGDEGKGLVTDYLSDSKTLVVRFNGGAQAGHTVVTPEGNRHVFHHFGSGTFAGAATFLSPFFIVNPIFYGRELAELRSKTVEPRVFVDPGCLVTTPYDMLLNEAAERMRGNARHGSCGFGINETVVRNEDPDFALPYALLRNTVALRSKLLDIRERYVSKRAAVLGIKEEIPHRWSDALVENYLKDVESMLGHAKSEQWAGSFLADWSHLVFEGAQGLRLDMDSPDFPYVTRSKTGLANVMTLVRAAGISETLNVHYLTRAYLTRHGAGPLLHEIPHPPYKGVVDDTNVPNPHQGTLRFAWLDLDQLLWFIQRDLASVPEGLSLAPHLVVTCADQLQGEAVRVFKNGREQAMPLDALLSQLLRTSSLEFKSGLVAAGRTRATVRAASPAGRRLVKPVETGAIWQTEP